MTTLLPLVLAAVVTVVPISPARVAAADETRISIDVKDADVIDVVRLLSEVGGFQVVVDPGVSCKLTLKLTSVPWPSVLNVALKVCGLGQEEDNGIVRIAPVARLTAEEAARRKLAEEQRLNRPLETTRYRLSYARAEDLAPILKKFLSPRGEIVVDPRTNTLIITDIR
jgi:type IV pilus assembly protein PilQ